MSLTTDGIWKGGVWAPTVWADGVWREGAAPEPPDPPAPEPERGAERFAGGYFPATRRRSQEEIEQARAMVGIPAAAEAVISAVAAGPPSEDAHKRFEELERELTLRGIEWEGRYLEALTAKLEAQRMSDEQALLALVALIA